MKNAAASKPRLSLPDPDHLYNTISYFSDLICSKKQDLYWNYPDENHRLSDMDR